MVSGEEGSPNLKLKWVLWLLLLWIGEYGGWDWWIGEYGGRGIGGLVLLWIGEYGGWGRG